MQSGCPVRKSDQRFKEFEYKLGEFVAFNAEKYLQLTEKTYFKQLGKVVKIVGLTIESVGPGCEDQ